ncbi:AGE family epimerase/isomerase [Gilvimarinus sp. SDUM040013]|uniref:Cellobiose 2-epimerase n=1 Tax=Gilvimarinus gilvus TaxID=3058038 RepID=A0ABU4S1A4_9GAMM|nr:AGE family epimerase/isomerase [Gilvimarinus sp. SDUM040013]MDO3387554.1 AGE family epimerase/isomerase [Gilvimarinus sp. SDUM040013]MDX6850181.1 AGE family epimerase/isomerase [Gilvimarinus sp. SDUM040013]
MQQADTTQPSSVALSAAACDAELDNIARWWLRYGIDNTFGGFAAEISQDNRINNSAPKGLVLNARILWFFSEAAHYTGNPEYRAGAERAFAYIQRYFFDAQAGGYFWSLNPDGSVCDDKKQVYAQAFVIYALAAYVEMCGDQSALEAAMQCFALIEQHCVDREGEGYLEAYTRHWGVIDDVRLSEKDLNYPKTMNTHLHVVEAYTKLYQVHRTVEVGLALAYGIDLIDKYMINRDSFHLRMFMGANWNDHSPEFTYGHDIECAWLLYKALVSLDDKDRIERLLPDILALARTCQREALDEFGAVLDGEVKATGKVHRDRVWWVQAEAMVGFLYAWKLSQDESYLRNAQMLWSFIQQYQLDHEHGEWNWHCSLDEIDEDRDYKVGFWKGPYHNGRAMIEAAKLLQEKV